MSDRSEFPWQSSWRYRASKQAGHVSRREEVPSAIPPPPKMRRAARLSLSKFEIARQERAHLLLLLDGNRYPAQVIVDELAQAGRFGKYKNCRRDLSPDGFESGNPAMRLRVGMLSYLRSTRLRILWMVFMVKSLSEEAAQARG